MFFVTTSIFSSIYTPQAMLPELKIAFHIDITKVNLLISAMLYVLILGTPIYAPISAAIGRKKTMVFSTLLLIIPTFVAALAPTFSWLLICRIFQGLFIPGVTAIMLAYVLVTYPKENVGLAIGMYMSASSLGGVLGRLLAGWITQWFSWRAAFLFFAVLLIIAVFLMIFWLPKDPSHTEKRIHWNKIRPLVTNPKILTCLLIPLIVFFSFMSITTFSTFYLANPPFNLNPGQLGNTFLILLLGTLISPITGKWSDKIGRTKIIFIGIFLLFIGTGLTLVPIFLVVLVGFGLVTIGMFTVQSVAPAYIGELAGSEKTTSSVLYQMFFYLGGALGTLLPSLFWTKYQYIGIVILTDVVILMGLLFFIMSLFSKQTKQNIKCWVP